MAKKSIGLLNIVFGASLGGFERAMKKAQKSIAKFSTKMRNVGKKLTTNVTLPILGLGLAAVKMAADFEETDSKFKTVFSSIQKQAEKTADVFKKSFGLSEKAAKQLLADTGDLLVGFGFTEQAALDLSQKVNELAVDLASFTNFSGGAKGASLALTKALLGERESIKSLGIAITEADLKSFAAEQGLVWKELDRITKANLTFQLAMKQSSKAVGDFSRTSGSLTNQTRILQSALTDLAVEFGTILIPLAQQIVTTLREFTEALSDLSPKTKEFIVKMAGWAAVIWPIVVFVSSLVSAFGKLLPLISQIGTGIAKHLGVWGKLAVVVLATGKGIYQMITGQRELTDLEKNLSKETEDLNKELDTQNDILGNLLKNLKKLENQRKVSKKTKLTALPTLGPTLMPVEGEGPMGSVGAAIADITRKQEELNATTALFGDIMHNAMMDAANAQEGFFQSLFENLKRAIKQMLIQLAVLTAINIMLGGKGGVEAFNLAKGKLLGLQHGGLVTGPTMALVGEGAGTSISNPEVIAPLDQLKNYMGGDMRVTGRLVGNDIFLSNEKAGVSRNRFV
tara:strand:- start:8625 stop:10328 length:1704 start_codon:yes stop_codon:yes gene_type:complete